MLEKNKIKVVLRLVTLKEKVRNFIDLTNIIDFRNIIIKKKIKNLYKLLRLIINHYWFYFEVL